MTLPLDEERTLDGTPEQHLADHLILHDIVNGIQRGRPKTATTTMYMVPGIPIGLASTKFLGGNRLHYSPIFVDTEIAVDRIATEVTSPAAAGNTVRMGIYAADADWQPGALVADAGTVDTDSPGHKELTIAETLTPGPYLLAFHTSTAGATHRAYRGLVPGGAIDIGQGAASNLVVQVWENRAQAPLSDPGNPWSVINGANVGWEYYSYLRISVP